MGETFTRRFVLMRTFESLTEQEILALAISLEEDDARIYEDFAEGLKADYPEQSEKFKELRRQEDTHRHRLLDLHRSRFGEHVPMIRRENVRGFVNRRPVWLVRPLGLKAVQKTAELMELETKRFYEAGARRACDAGIRQLLGDLAEEERNHAHTAQQIGATKLSEGESAQHKRLFVLQVIQPGLAGLMDGSVSTLAPLFAAAFATHSSIDTFRVGLAASVGAGISMGFAEALSDDGTLTGRGHPWARGFVCGLMTTLGGLGHTLPYLLRDVRFATWIAVAVVLVELGIISWVRHRFMDTPLGSAVVQVALGGALVFAAGVLIGVS
ncbi:MAG: rubrerythrin [Verrucomicrobiales bacterium]|nr:rubrerythrin [Verrucomicrobiales bacterium]